MLALLAQYTDLYSSVFLNDAATTELYTLSLHDALPIYISGCAEDGRVQRQAGIILGQFGQSKIGDVGFALLVEQDRSEEHTSELQSQFHLVCRLLLEKRN